MKEIKVWKAILLYLGIEFLVAFIGAILFGEELNINLAVLIASIITLLIILKMGKINKKVVYERINDFKVKFRFKEIIVVVITQILISLALAYIISALMYMIDPQSAVEMMSEELFESNNYMDIFLGMIMTIFMAPVIEEILFRRIMFTRFSKRLGFVFSAILSSILFGILHLELAMIGAIIFGFTACLLYQKYNNILIPISMHFINNAIAGIFMIISLFFESSETVDYTMTNQEINISLCVGGLLLIISGIMFGLFVYKNREYLKKNREVISVKNEVVE